eukprot:3477179-Rhodomonas_salina.2
MLPGDNSGEKYPRAWFYPELPWGCIPDIVLRVGYAFPGTDVGHAAPRRSSVLGQNNGLRDSIYAGSASNYGDSTAILGAAQLLW